MNSIFHNLRIIEIYGIFRKDSLKSDRRDLKKDCLTAGTEKNSKNPVFFPDQILVGIFKYNF